MAAENGLGMVELSFAFVPALLTADAFELPPVEFPLAVSDCRNEFDSACESANVGAAEARSEAVFGGGKLAIDVPICVITGPLTALPTMRLLGLSEWLLRGYCWRPSVVRVLLPAGSTVPNG